MELRNRLQGIRDLKELLQYFNGRICFERTDLQMILQAASKTGPKRYRNICSQINDTFHFPLWNDFQDLWSTSWMTAFPSHKCEEEKEIWNRFGRQLGKGGQEQQRQAIQQCSVDLDRLESLVTSECIVKGKMYSSLGICIGIFLTVLLI